MERPVCWLHCKVLRNNVKNWVTAGLFLVYFVLSYVVIELLHKKLLECVIIGQKWLEMAQF